MSPWKAELDILNDNFPSPVLLVPLWISVKSLTDGRVWHIYMLHTQVTDLLKSLAFSQEKSNVWISRFLHEASLDFWILAQFPRSQRGPWPCRMPMSHQMQGSPRRFRPKPAITPRAMQLGPSGTDQANMAMFISFYNMAMMNMCQFLGNKTSSLKLLVPNEGLFRRHFVHFWRHFVHILARFFVLKCWS
jgi:hypothetical protein